MKPEVVEALDTLKRVTPTNVHLITNIRHSKRLDFESLWLRHGPQAARYSLLPDYVAGKLEVL